MRTGVEITTVDPNVAAQGGLSAIQINQLDRRTGLDVVALTQSAPDSFTQYRVHLHNGVIGSLEALLVGGKNGGALSTDGTVPYRLADTSVEFGNDITADPTKAGRPILYGINFGGDALPDARNFFFHEMVLVVPFSTPSGSLILFAPDTLGNPALSFPPPDIGVGNKFRIQGLYAEPFSPTSGVMATNQIRFNQM